MTSSTILYLPHGGGPLPLLGHTGHQEMVDGLKDIVVTIAKPSAILVVSAHWEQRVPTITHGANPSLIYDYYGFPDASYEIQYSVPGEPQLADKIFSCLNDKGFEAVLDDQRGFDHGLFVPLKIMCPDADIPCVQLSLLDSLNPQEHIKMGEALSELKQEGLLVIGSGMSFHNLETFFKPNQAEAQTMNETFEQWLIKTCSGHELDEAERTQRLINWQEAPSARYCHPREEHLLPLHVCYGMAQRACREVFELSVMGKKVSMYLW